VNPGFRELLYSSEVGVSAIVRSLKPKLHIDDASYDATLKNNVKIVPWSLVVQNGV
jgi:hypothetical protein